MTYADRTEVPPERSRAEIERTLARFGADSFAYVSQPDLAAVAFRAHNKTVRFELPLPIDPAEFRRTKSGWRNPGMAQKAMDAEIRRRWRCLLLLVKGKLEAVESGIVTFEEEFLAHLVLPSGATVAAELIPEIEEAAGAGRMPDLHSALAGRPALGPGEL